ncbi:MAG: inositol monophosphatase [Candidatus Diapherotrites archaeon]|uniref:inositol-phosphate phosphatase n=1 Tax=Candidatus Iainarchaeum sp. TaxID=3101447 RepID=A0A8T4KZE1_9ARCH|nr:inositol monophosphatase [Candidatus Diapherotrites archaeon]
MNAMESTIKKSLRASGKILMKSFGKIQKYSVKENQSSIVTKADLASEKAIVKIIQKEFPKHNIIAEETGFKSNNSEYTWIVDPLDGTSNFASGIPWFGIFIALLKASKPIASGIYLPFYDLMYFAEKGKGATRNGRRILVSKEKAIKNVLLSYSLDYSEDPSKTENEVKIIKLLVQNTRNLRATNSAIDYCYAADGRLGGCINQTSKIWDVVAPYLIIKEAGGIVTDIYGNDMEFSADKGNYLRNFTIVASNKYLRPEIMNIIRQVMP